MKNGGSNEGVATFFDVRIVAYYASASVSTARKLARSSTWKALM